jgi:hypothetical protein
VDLVGGEMINILSTIGMLGALAPALKNPSIIELIT